MYHPDIAEGSRQLKIKRQVTELYGTFFPLVVITIIGFFWKYFLRGVPAPDPREGWPQQDGRR